MTRARRPDRVTRGRIADARARTPARCGASCPTTCGHEKPSRPDFARAHPRAIVEGMIPRSARPERVDDIVWDALHDALSDRRPVILTLRRDPTVPPRNVNGTPRRLYTAPDGRVRVVLDVADGTEQHIVVERIARVLPAA